MNHFCRVAAYKFQFVFVWKKTKIFSIRIQLQFAKYFCCDRYDLDDTLNIYFRTPDYLEWKRTAPKFTVRKNAVLKN